MRFQIKKFPNFTESYDNFQKVAKNIEGFLFYFFLKLPSYLLCSQIFLNYFLDDCHFGYVTKSLKETLLVCIGRNHIFFRSKFGENSPVKPKEMLLETKQRTTPESIPSPFPRRTLRCVSSDLSGFCVCARMQT